MLDYLIINLYHYCSKRKLLFCNIEPYSSLLFTLFDFFLPECIPTMINFYLLFLLKIIGDPAITVYILPSLGVSNR